VLLTWPAAWITHWLQVPVRGIACIAGTATVITWLAWAWRNRRAAKADNAGPDGQEPQLRGLFLPTEAALVAAAWGGWVTVAVVFGPTARPDRWPTLVYLTGAAGGYWSLRRHEAVRAARTRRDAAAAWTARKAEWHRIAHRIGLGDFHLQEITRTHLGEELLLTSAPGSELATRIAANSRPYVEKYAHLRGLPYGRVDIRLTDYPGQLVIEVREQDPSVDGPVIHPALDAASPYAAWFPGQRSIRQPIPIGVIPETGEPMELILFDEEGGKAVGVFSITGGGKTNVLDDIREAVTACDDAVLVQFNAAGSGDERVWEPLAALTMAGLAEENPQIKQGILGGLGYLRRLIGQRSETAADTGESVFQPTRENPAAVVIIDEIDETGKIEGASKLLEFLASKQRKAAVCLILAGQRATATWTGGAGVRINLSTMVIGVLARDSETRHAVGAENEIPDISEYSGGQAGYFGIWSVRQKKYLQRGRSFYIGKLGEQRDKIIAKRDPAARPVLQDASQIEVTAPVISREQSGSGLRERLAHVRQLNDHRPPGPASTGPLPVVPGVPPEVMAVLRPILASGRTSAAAVGLRLGVSKTTAHGYLAAMRQYGIAEVTGSGRSSGWQLTQRPKMPEPMREPPGQYATTAQYATLEDLAQAVHDGLVDADEDARTVLDQVRRIAGRKRLSAVPDPPGDGQ